MGGKKNARLCFIEKRDQGEKFEYCGNVYMVRLCAQKFSLRVTSASARLVWSREICSSRGLTNCLREKTNTCVSST